MMARNMFVISFLAVGAWGCSARIGPDVRQVSTVVLPDPSVSSMSQGRVLFGRGEYALAIEEFRKAIRETPDSPEGYNALASSYDMIGRFDLASRLKTYDATVIAKLFNANAVVAKAPVQDPCRGAVRGIRRG